MPILRAKKVEIQTYVAEIEITPEEAKELGTDPGVEAFVHARGQWTLTDEDAELVEGWEITEE